MKDKYIKQAAKLLLQGFEVDKNDRNFKTTPDRFVDAMHSIFRPPDKKFPVYEEGYNGWIIIRNHEAFTLCPHHLLPVRMDVSAGYIPSTHVVGLSKVPRLFDEVNLRPMLQEQLTNDLAEVLMSIKGCKGSVVIIKGQHMCMQARGIRTRGWVLTSAQRGDFEKADNWSSFLQLMRVGDV